jgi:hypothetical protein
MQSLFVENAEQNRNNRDYQKDEKQDSGNVGSARCNSTEAENGSDQSYHKKNSGVVKHVSHLSEFGHLS